MTYANPACRILTNLKLFCIYSHFAGHDTGDCFQIVRRVYNRILLNSLIKEMNNLRHIALIFAGLSCLPALAQSGRSAYDFLEIPTSAHVYGLGGANITVIDDDVTLAEQNPALLGPEVDRQVAFSYMRYMGDSNFASARFGMAAGEHAAWAAGIRYLNYGEISGYDEMGNYTGSFKPSDIVVEGSYSHDFTYRLRGGINLKGIFSDYEQYSAVAIAADLGLNYYNEERDLSMSITLKNMGGQVKRFDQAYDRLPFDVQLGWMKGINDSGFSLSVTAWHLTKWDVPYYEHTDDGLKEIKLKSSFGKNLLRHLIFGAQFQPSDQFYVDLSYNYKMRTDMGTYQRSFLSGFSAGMGLNVGSFKLGVAYSQPHKSASTLLFNVGLNLADLF